MSVIHKALREADDNRQQNSKAQFNPLWKTEKKTNPSFLLYSVALLFFIGAIALFIWPTDDTALTPTSLSNSTTSNEIDDEKVIEASTTEAAAKTPVEIKETASLPAAVESLQIPESEPTGQVETASANESTPDESDELVNTSETQTTAAKPVQSLAERQTVKSEKSNTPAESSSRQTTQDTPSNIEPTRQNSSASNVANNQSVIRSATDQWQQQIEQHISNGEIEKAELILKQWISTQPRDATPRIWLAKIYVNNGFYQAAEPLVSDIKHPEAQGLLGIIYERTARPAQASNVFEALYRSAPEEGKWLLFWAINTENSGQLAKSTALYQNYIQVFSDDDVNLTAFASQRLKAIRGQ